MHYERRCFRTEASRRVTVFLVDKADPIVAIQVALNAPAGAMEHHRLLRPLKQLTNLASFCQKLPMIEIVYIATIACTRYAFLKRSTASAVRLALKRLA